MSGSRTIKVLAALVVAMTIGAFALLAMDTDPIRPGAIHLAALAERNSGAAAIVGSTEVPLQGMKWRNIVIMSSTAGRGIERGCHFVVRRDGRHLVQATDLWKQQLDGRHTPVRQYNADSIGICVEGDFDVNQPSPEQFEALCGLIRVLQHNFRIYPDQIFLHSDLVSGSRSPGEAFPARPLAARLVDFR
jgi:hypothetical protein